MIMAETIGVVAVAMVTVPMVAVEGPTRVERTLVITITKGCGNKLQTSCKTREPCKKMHGNNCVNNMAQFR
jgi:predicted secreted Zn-dependent protease